MGHHTTTITALHKVDRRHPHYAEVRAAMDARGAPAIRCVWSRAHGWLALEGSHRLAVAAELGLCPEVVDVTGQTAVEHDADDYDSPADLTVLEDERGMPTLAAVLLDRERVRYGSVAYDYDGYTPGGAVAIEDTLRVAEAG